MKREIKDVKTIVKEALMEMGEDTLAKYPRALSYALSYYRKWHKEKARNYKYLISAPDELERVVLPDDYVDWVRIGVISGNRIIPAQENKTSIGVRPTQADGTPEGYPATNDARTLGGVTAGVYTSSAHSGLYGPNFNAWGENTGGVSGKAGNKPILNFTYLKEENAIQFNTGLAYNEVYIEYLANPFEIGQETLIHYYGIDPMKSYIWYMFAFHNKTSTEMEVDRKRRLHKKEHIDAGIQMSHITPHDMITYGRMFEHQGPRV